MKERVFVFAGLVLAIAMPIASASLLLDRTSRKLVSDHDDAAVAVYSRLAAEDGNFVFSPFCLNLALDMTYAGALGETARQMEEALHITLGPHVLPTVFGRLLQHMDGVASRNTDELRIANGLWYQTGRPLAAEFANTVRGSYGVPLFEMDLVHRPYDISTRINLWIRGRTANRIHSIVSPDDFGPDTVLMLINAMTFKGTWHRRFNPMETESLPFAVEPNIQVVVPMMYQAAPTRYARNDEASLISMPFSNGLFSMLVLLPNAINGLADLEANLTAESLQQLAARMHFHEAEIRLPRFTVQYDVDMANALKDLGMTDAFSAEDANFHGMSKERLHLSRVLHAARIEVDEEGAAAAAVSRTTADFGTETVEFKADHPFIFLVVENESGSIMLMGRVTNPAQSPNAERPPRAPRGDSPQ